jgi:hypothetical protein
VKDTRKYPVGRDTDTVRRSEIINITKITLNNSGNYWTSNLASTDCVLFCKYGRTLFCKYGCLWVGTRIRDILVRIRIRGYVLNSELHSLIRIWLPILLFSSVAFNTATKNYFLHLVPTFWSYISKIKSHKKSHKTVRYRKESTFFLLFFYW